MRTACVNANRIYQARLESGQTQADIAYKIRRHGHKANERSIRRWESGQHAPHANVVPALAEALGVSIESLYEQSDSDDDEEDEAALRRLAHMAIDREQTDIALALLERVKRLTDRRSREKVRP